MTIRIGAIDLVIAFASALVTMRNDVVGDSFTEALIKYKIFTNEPGGKLVFFNLSRVIDDAAVQLVHVFESMMFQECTCFFTAHATGAVHQNFLLFFSLELFEYMW